MKALGVMMRGVDTNTAVGRRAIRRLARSRRLGIGRLAAVLVLLNVASVVVGGWIVRGLLTDLHVAHQSKAVWSGWIAAAIEAEEHLLRLSRELRVNGDVSVLSDRREKVLALSAKLDADLAKLKNASEAPRLATRTQLGAKVAKASGEIERGLASAEVAFAAAAAGDSAKVYALAASSVDAMEEAREQVMLMQARFRHELDVDLAESVRKEHALGTAATVTAGVLLMVAGLIGFIMFRFIRRMNEVEFAALKHRRRERAALAQADRAARVKADFLAHMSHELRTPLTSILGFVGVLLEEGDRTKAPPARLEALRTIQVNSAHLLRVLGDVLDLAGLNAGLARRVQEPVDVALLVEGAIGRVSGEAARRGLTLRCVNEGPIPRHVLSDGTLMERVLDALVRNAVKFTERGSICVRVCYQADESVLRILVIDTGIGMSEQQLVKLFKEFEQGDPSMARRYGGAGLGLAIAHRAATHLGGRLSVSSQPGAGSTFVFEVPATAASNSVWMSVLHAVDTTPSAAGTAAASLIPEKDAAGVPLSGRTIVLAEDSPDIRRLVGSLLRSAGARVVVSENGKEAVERVQELIAAGTPPALVFMDMQMPVMDGYEATRTLRGAGVVLPIVALTAHALPEDRARCLAAGCSEYVTKPVTKATLVGVCVRLCGAGALSAAA